MDLPAKGDINLNSLKPRYTGVTSNWHKILFSRAWVAENGGSCGFNIIKYNLPTIIEVWVTNSVWNTAHKYAGRSDSCVLWRGYNENWQMDKKSSRWLRRGESCPSMDHETSQQQRSARTFGVVDGRSEDRLFGRRKRWYYFFHWAFDWAALASQLSIPRRSDPGSVSWISGSLHIVQLEFHVDADLYVQVG